MPPFSERLRAGATSIVVLAALLTSGTSPAQATAADLDPLSDLQLDIALNQEYQNPNSRGGVCNFFSAGTGDEGGVFRERVGDVSIVKLDENGTAQRASRANICLPMSGSSIEQRARFSHGSGTLDPETGVGEVRWTGAFTANAYAGLVPWTVTDPVLTVNEDGSGHLRAIAGGFGATEENPEGGFPLRPREVTLATFSAVSVERGEVVVTPDFFGRDYFALDTPGEPENGRSAESAIPAHLKADTAWGSWPESFVDFHYESGLSSYWHTSGGSADPDKVPLPIRVRATEDETVERPVITANPTADRTFPVLEGDDLEITAAVTGASSCFWERKDGEHGEWRAIEGTDDQVLRLPGIGGEWNGSSVRLVAENRGGRSYSGELRLSTEARRGLRIEGQPRPVLAIEGMRPVLDLSVTGTPAPTGFTVERRTGQGEWAEIDGVTVARGDGGSTHRLTLPRADAAGAGELRVQITNRLGDTVRTDSISYRVAAATGEPQIVIGAGSGVDAAEGGEVTVVGANFIVPENDRNGSFSLDVALFADEDWQPGEEASQDWIATSPDSEWGQLYRASLSSSGGAFTVRIRVDAGVLDPERSYGVATFLRHTNLWWMSSYDDRRADTFTRLPLVAPAADPVAVAESELTEQNRGGVVVEVEAGGRVVVTVPGQRPDSNVFLSVRSESQPLGWRRLDQELSAAALLPTGFAPGSHRVVVQDVSGALLGWAPFDLAAPTGTGDSSGAGSSGGDSGRSATAVVGSDAATLAATGAESAIGVLVLGVLALLAGSVLTALRRRRRI